MVELNLEIRNNRMQIIVLRGSDPIPRSELQLFFPDIFDINIIKHALRGDHGTGLHDIDDGFGHHGRSDDAHVDAIHVLPELQLLFLIVRVLDARHIEFGPVRKHKSVRVQPLVPGEHDCVQHALVQQEVPHPLGDYDVHLLHRQLHLLHLAPDDGDLVGEAVVLHYLLRLDRDVGRVDAVDVTGTCPAREDRENAGATADVQHDLVLEDVRVLDHRVHVGLRTHLVLDHLLVDSVVRVRVEVGVLR